MSDDSKSSLYCWSVRLNYTGPQWHNFMPQQVNKQLIELDSIDRIVESMSDFPEVNLLLEQLK